MKWTRFAFAVLLAGSAWVVAADGPVPTTQTTARRHRPLGPPWQDEYPLSIPEWGVSGVARVTVLKPTGTVDAHGRRLRLRFEFTNTGGEWSFYDLFPSRRLAPPFMMAVYDADTKEPAGWLSLGTPTGYLNAAPGDWMRLPSEATVSQVLTPLAPKHRFLLQLVFTPEFVRLPEGKTLPEGFPPNPSSLQGRELFRSNAVLVEDE